MSKSVFVNSENKVVFTCPQCTKSKTADVSKFLGQKSDSQIKVRCRCGHVFQVTLERRKFYRKKTMLHGFYTLENSLKQFPITVVNLSRRGLEFKTSQSHLRKVGEKLSVEFRLDDKKKSLIKKEVVIRRVDKDNIGGEFCFQDEYDKVLGFYFF
jgi:hypothetical protein